MIIGVLIVLVFIIVTVAFVSISFGAGGKSTIKMGFWRRQFQIQTTSKQKIFDWIFGVGLPVICFVFDPIVFKNNGVGNAILGNLKPFAYLLSFISVLAMSAWLIWGAKLKVFGVFFAGAFAVGGMISLIVGIVLVPFSLIGLIFLVGILGFTPLFSAIVFLRNAIRAYHAAKPFIEKPILIYSVVLSAIFSLMLPAVVNLEIKRSFENIKNGDVQTVRAEAKKLKYVAPLVNFEGLALLYFSSSSSEEQRSEKMKEIAEFYEEMTGKDIKNSFGQSD